MQLVIVSLAVLALGSALPSHKQPHTYGLNEDFEKFIALIPVDKIVPIAMDYLMNDAEVQEAMTYVQSEDFQKLVLDFEGIPEYLNFLKYLEKEGLDIYAAVQKFHELLGLPDFVPPRSVVRRGSGIRGLIDDIKAVLPIDDIKALYHETLASSTDFANFVNVLKGDEFKSLVEKLRANPTFKELVAKAKEHGVDVDLIIELLNKILGWGIEARHAIRM